MLAFGCGQSRECRVAVLVQLPAEDDFRKGQRRGWCRCVAVAALPIVGRCGGGKRMAFDFMQCRCWSSRLFFFRRRAAWGLHSCFQTALEGVLGLVRLVMNQPIAVTSREQFTLCGGPG